MKLENLLRSLIGKNVRLVFETSQDGFSIAGKLMEVTDDYIKLYGMTTIYVNRKATILTYLEVYEEGKQKNES